MVDLSELKAGDTVVFRGGRTDVVEFVEKLNGEVKRPYKIHYYNDGVPETYTKDGYFNSTDCESAMDIVEIIPQSKEDSDKPKVDLSTLRVGDTVVFRNGQVDTVKEIKPTEDVIYDFIINSEAYTNDGFFYFTKEERAFDIVEVKKAEEKTDDPVNNPSHYTIGGIECIDAIKASMTPEAYKGYLKGNILKYLWRYEKKANPVEDLKKARTYLDWLIKENENE